jgi:hypothetical protein
MFALLVCSCSIEINQTSGPPIQSNTPAISSTSIVAGTRVPVTWAHLDLTGKLVYLSSTMEGDALTSDIQMLDLVTGSISTIFNIPSAWVYYAAVSPDAKMLVMSYAPPSQPNSPSSRSLYMIPLAAFAEPQPLSGTRRRNGRRMEDLFTTSITTRRIEKVSSSKITISHK